MYATVSSSPACTSRQHRTTWSLPSYSMTQLGAQLWFIMLPWGYKPAFHNVATHRHCESVSTAVLWLLQDTRSKQEHHAPSPLGFISSSQMVYTLQ